MRGNNQKQRDGLRDCACSSDFSLPWERLPAYLYKCLSRSRERAGLRRRSITKSAEAAAS
jgi:hypothetical protein